MSGTIETAEALGLAKALGAACTAEDGVPPFNDQALVELARGDRRAIGDATALAVLSDAEREVELAVHPEQRGRGLGTALARRVADELGAFEAWAHGDHPAARAIARRLPATQVRTLLQLRAPVPAAGGTAAAAASGSSGAAAACSPSSVAASSHGGAHDESGADRLPDGTRTYESADASALLALNAAAFADHPEQGRMSADDLAARMAEPWHDDANLVVAPGERGGERGLDAFAWVKPDAAEPGIAELYVLGVAPGLQGAGLGRRMLEAAFVRMRALGATTAHLYVEGDNEPALALYRRAGFEQWAIDVRWRHGDAPAP